jgi:hypothetical protein
MPEIHSGESVKPGLARAWFDTALNPLIRGLRTEAEFIEHGNLTWRMHNEQFVCLFPVREQISVEAWDNFEQFLSIYPSLSEVLDRHDSALQTLHERVSEFYAALVHHPQLAEMLRRAMETESRLRDAVTGNRVAELPRYVAEYIVNDLGTLPDYNSIASFWNDKSSEFLALRERPEIQPLWEAVKQARSEFGRGVEALTKAITDVRKELSFKLDVPIVERVAS